MVYFQSYRWNYLPGLHNIIQACSRGNFCFFVRKLSKNPLVMEIFALSVETTSCWRYKKQGVYGELLCPKLSKPEQKVINDSNCCTIIDNY